MDIKVLPETTPVIGAATHALLRGTASAAQTVTLFHFLFAVISSGVLDGEHYVSTCHEP